MTKVLQDIENLKEEVIQMQSVDFKKICRYYCQFTDE